MSTYKKYSNTLENYRWLYHFIQLVADIIFTLMRIISKLLPLRRESICVISLHKLGDSIFTFDAINSIKEFYKEKIFIICNESALPIYKLIFDEKNLVPFDKKYFHFGDRYIDSRGRILLRKLKPKVIIDLTGVMTSATLIFNSRAKEIIGFNRKIFRRIYDEYSEFNLGNHSSEIYTNAIKKVIPIVEFENKIRTDNKSGRILIAPFAGWSSKEWSLYRYIELAKLLSKNNDVCLIFDQRKLDQILLEYMNAENITFKRTDSVSELIDEIKNCKMLIGNDSGPVHIAALLGKITFTIYGPTNPRFHLPRGDKHYFIQKKLPCTPKENERLCFTDGGKDGCPSYECIHSLETLEVFEEIRKIILQ